MDQDTATYIMAIQRQRDERVIDGLARAMWTEAHAVEPRIEWANEYDWVRAKWLRYARVAVCFLAAHDVGASAQDGHQTRPTMADTSPE